MRNRQAHFIFIGLLLGGCLGTGCGMTQAELAPPKQPLTTIAKPPQKLAKQVLVEMGLAAQYDRYLGNSVDLVLAPNSKQPKFRQWLQGILAQKAGWRYAETAYVAQLTANFSEAELQELLAIAQRPVMKKLRQAEIQAYGDAAGQRQKLFGEVWDDYNSGRFIPPPEVLRESGQPLK